MMEGLMKVKDCMSRNVVSVGAQEPVFRCSAAHEPV